MEIPENGLKVKFFTTWHRCFPLLKTKGSTSGKGLRVDEAILQRFLNNGLINVGGDDTKLEKLSQAAKDLVSILKKTPSKALNYSLIAFDPEAPLEDPVVQEALAALQNRWATYRNTFSSTPVAVIRALLLDALLIAAADDDRIGVCFVASARNALPLLRADNERAIWSDAVLHVENQVDARAEAEWATPDSISVPAMSYDLPEIETPEIIAGKVPHAKLQMGMLAAIGPHYYDHQQGTNVSSDGNPHWPQNNPGQWASEFGRRASLSIAEAINSAISDIKSTQPDLADPFNQLASAVSSYVDTSLKAVSTATAGLQRRTNLLWWKEALFSPSARTSYRELPVTVAAAQMAFDLFNAVPLFSPSSVSAFLGEAVLSLPGSIDGKKRFVRDLVAEGQEFETLAPLRSVAADLIAVPEGRGPLLALIGHPTHANARKESSFQMLSGVPMDAELAPVAWAGWIFRELQAARAASDGSPTKRRSAKKS